FHSKSYDNFNIPYSIDDFGKYSSDQENNSTSNKISSIFKDFQEDYNNNKETMKHHSYIDDEVHNNPNLHSEEQDELEIPDALTLTKFESVLKEWIKITFKSKENKIISFANY
ncbi:hypothetical protein RhiirA1_402883, partial [Rhizophagus irregularis]